MFHNEFFVPCLPLAVHGKYIDAIWQVRHRNTDVIRIVFGLGENGLSDNIADMNLALIQWIGEREMHRFGGGIGI